MLASSRSASIAFRVSRLSLSGLATAGFILASWVLAGAPASAGIAAPSYTLHDLRVMPGYTSSQAAGINNTREVVGSSANGQASTAAWFGGNGIINLGTSLSGNSYAGGINSSGEIVGYSAAGGFLQGGPAHAFLYSPGAAGLKDLGTLGGLESDGYGINDSGEVVGSSDTTGGWTDGFLYVDGQMYDLNNLVSGDAGNVIASAVATNASGQIAADAVTPSGQEHAVLLTATSVAFPSALWAGLSMLPLLLLLRKPPRLLRLVYLFR